MFGRKDKSRETSLQTKVTVWMYLGPLLLLLSLSSFLLFPLPDPILWVLFSCVAMFLCTGWEMKGFWTVLPALCGIGFFQVEEISGVELHWYLALLSSLTVSFLITALGSQELQHLLTPLQNECIEKETLIQKIKDESLQKEKILQAAMESLQRKLQNQTVEIEEKKEEGPKSSSVWEDRYKILKQQFEEKSQVLDQTRKELFEKDHNYLILQREKLFSSMQEDPEQRHLIELVSSLQMEKEALEKELLSLEELLHKMLIQER